MRRLLCRLSLLAVVVLSTLGSRCSGTIIGTPATVFTLTLTSNFPNDTSTIGQEVTFTAGVMGDERPVGSVDFFDGTTRIGSSALSKSLTSCPCSEIATFKTSTLAVGQHTIAASFAPGGPAPVARNSILFTVNPGTAPGFGASPNPLAFGNQVQGTTSAPMTLTFSNPGTAMLTITALTLMGANPADFVRVGGAGTCTAAPIGFLIPAGGNCTVQFTFTPSTTAGESATLNVTDNAPGSPQMVSFMGTGTPPAGGTPVITQVNPNMGQQGTTITNVMITGQFTHFAAGNMVSFAPDSAITASNVMVTDATHLTATLMIPASVATGPQTVTVTTGTEIASLANGFTVNPGTPTITGVLPNQGQQGITLMFVAITGQFTHFVQNMSMVSFSPDTTITASNVTVTDATHLTVTLMIPAGAMVGAQTVTVTTNPEIASLTNGFTVTQAPVCLFGNYVFLFNGFDSTTLLTQSVVIGGFFTVNAAGNVTTGVEDINRSSGVTTSVVITSGTCTLSANRGTLTLNTTTPVTTTIYHFTLDAVGRLGNGRFIEFDAAGGMGTRGSGFLEAQAGSFHDLSGLAGERIFELAGYNGATGVRAAAVGRFTLDPTTCISTSTACAIINGQMDVSTPNTTSGALTLTGSFNALDPATGRGTAQLVIPANPTSVQGTFNFSYYFVRGGLGISDDNVVLVPTDVRGTTVPTVSGRTRLQRGCCTLDSTALGSVIFSTEGIVASGNPSVAIGQMTGATGALTGTLEQNAGGAITRNAAFTAGSYGVAANGRTSFTFTAGGIMKTQVAYLSSAFPFGTRGPIMDAPGSDVSFGGLTTQNGTAGFGNSSLSGAFNVNSESPTSFISINESGQAMLDGIGTMTTSFSLTVDISSATGLFPNQMLMGTYSVSNNGRALASGQTLVLWIISATTLGTASNGQFVCISTVTAGDANPLLLRFVQ